MRPSTLYYPSERDSIVQWQSIKFQTDSSVPRRVYHCCRAVFSYFISCCFITISYFVTQKQFLKQFWKCVKVIIYNDMHNIDISGWKWLSLFGFYKYLPNENVKGIVCNFYSKIESIHIHFAFPPSIRHCKNMLGVLLQKDASFATVYATVYCLHWREGRLYTLVNQ